MSKRLSQIARDLNLELKGQDKLISGCNTLEAAGEDEISFLANPKYERFLESTKAAAVVLDKGHAHKVGTCLISPEPYLSFAQIAQMFASRQGRLEGLSPQAFISEEAVLGNNVTVYPFAFIGPGVKIQDNCTIFSHVYIGEDCQIGSGCQIYPNVTLMAGTCLGNKVTIHSGTVLGSDGFGFAMASNSLEKIPQTGRVVVEDNVEIGANCSIDRAALGETRIDQGTKMDNQIQIGHNVQIGSNSVIVAQVGVSGSCKIGDNVILAGQVGIAGHLEIGNNCRIGAQSGVNKSLKPGTDVTGSPAIKHSKYLRSANLFSKLPDMHKKIKELEKELSQMKSLIQGDKTDGQ